VRIVLVYIGATYCILCEVRADLSNVTIRQDRL